MRVMICGAGVAGVTLACQLVEHGHDVHLVEAASAPRRGGYMIDFFGPGYDTAERMALLAELARIHQPVEDLIFVDAAGDERLRVPYPDLRAAFDGRHFNFPRGDLAGVLFDRLGDRARATFGTTVERYTQTSSEVAVVLGNGETHTCDLLVGADGIHSQVRKLMMNEVGDTANPIRFLGYHAIFFHVGATSLPQLPERALYLWAAPGQIATVYPESEGFAVFVAHSADAPPCDKSPQAVRSTLRARYADAGWVFGRLIDGFDGRKDVYFDEVSQVEVSRWSDGRVVLLGDACQCVSLLAGQGASIAMGAAEVLARQLETASSVERALSGYQKQMRPAVERKQRSGRRIAEWFVPATRGHVVLSRMFMRMLKVPGLRQLAARGVDSSAIGNA